MGQMEVDAQVARIEQTEERLAAAIEGLAYKKAHVREEVTEIAQDKADEFLVKAEETKDRLVAAISQKIPEPGDVKDAALQLGAKAAESASAMASQVVAQVGATAREKVPEVREETSEIAGKILDAAEQTKESAVRRLHRTPPPEPETRTTN